MGAYIVLFPGSRILTLIPLLFFFFTMRIPALIILGYWFVIQFLSGISTIGEINQGGVAWWAHIGGFILGMFLVGDCASNAASPIRLLDFQRSTAAETRSDATLASVLSQRTPAANRSLRASTACRPGPASSAEREPPRERLGAADPPDRSSRGDRKASPPPAPRPWD